MRKENLEKILHLRHRLHMHPELSMREAETWKMIRQFLADNTGLRVIDCGGWGYAIKDGKKDGERIAFRADMDALPISEGDCLPWHSQCSGISHKCGHDGHSAALCGLALELDSRETEKTVCLLFQPGEETGQGAFLCREVLHREGISEIFAFHNLGGYPENSIVYREGLTQPASEGMRIIFSGKTSHASAPEEGKNPAEVISKTVLYAMERASARRGGMVLCTVTGIRLGEGDFGISPGKGELCFTLRAEEESEMKQLEAEIRRYVLEICNRTGMQADISMHDYFPETRNHSRSLSRVLKAAKEAGLQTIPMERMWRASEDFGWYLKECRGAMIYIGNGTGFPALHTAEYDFNDAILETAADLFLRLALEGAWAEKSVDEAGSSFFEACIGRGMRGKSQINKKGKTEECLS